MLSLIISGFILIANIIAILAVYFSFGKKMDKNKKLMGTMITVGLVYILITIVFFFSSLGIGKSAGYDTSKQMLTLAFVPVTTLLFAPFLIHSWILAKDKKLSVDKLSKRMAICGVLLILLIVFQFFYFRNTLKTINKLQEAINNTIQNSVSTNSQVNDIENGEITNTVTNEVENSLSKNTTNTEGNSVNAI